MPRHPLLRRSAVVPQRSSRPVNHPLPAVHRLGADDGNLAGAVEGGALARDARLALVEAALLGTDEPLTLRRLVVVAGLADGTEARRLVKRLQELYDQDGTAFQVNEVAGGFQLQTRPEFHPWLVRLRRGMAELRLTPAARETLAMIAYRQPVTRADIEAIRGVQSSEVLQQLMEKGLVRIGGRDDSLGRPMLYQTTKKFLQLYGLKGLKDLPRAEELGGPEKKKPTE